MGVGITSLFSLGGTYSHPSDLLHKKWYGLKKLLPSYYSNDEIHRQSGMIALYLMTLHKDLTKEKWSQKQLDKYAKETAQSIVNFNKDPYDSLSYRFAILKERGF